MGRYYDMVKANFNKLRNDEGVMWGSIEMWDKHLEEMREHHPDKYWEMMRHTHELMYGKHFTTRSMRVGGRTDAPQECKMARCTRESIGRMSRPTEVMQKYRGKDICGDYSM